MELTFLEPNQSNKVMRPQQTKARESQELSPKTNYHHNLTKRQLRESDDEGDTGTQFEDFMLRIFER